MLDEEGLRALQERVQNPPSLDEALPASKELVEALTPLAAESPAKYQAQLATAWKFRGVHLGLAEHQDEAEEAFATAADLFRGLATVTDPESLFTFAISLIDLADHRLKQDDDAVRRALESIEEIRGLGEQLARDDATVAEDLQTHAARLHALALHRLGDHPAAIEQAERAHRGLTRMERRDPEARVLAAENLRTLGMSLSEVNRFKDARKRLEDSRYLFRRLAKREPELFLVEHALVTLAIAAIYLKEGKMTRAASYHEAAADLYRDAARLDPALHDEYRETVASLLELYRVEGDARSAERLTRRHSS